MARNLGTYKGEEKLVFCFDVGTTNSAVAVSYLANGQEPDVRVVNNWPGQGEFQGASKIPTLVRYDQDGKAVQFGGEAGDNDEGLEDTHLVRWFKLFLHPDEMRASNKIHIPSLPTFVSLDTVYADFLRYLFSATTDFICDRLVNQWGGHQGHVWPRLKQNFELCMAIPNGWGLKQQEFLRNAIVAAGILPRNHARDRVQFVPESESSVHFAVQYARAGNWLRPGTVFAICDAGGSTVDTVIYKCKASMPKLVLEEVVPSECVQAGGAFVDMAAKELLRKRFQGTHYGQNESLDAMVRSFEQKTKRKFDGGVQEMFINFAPPYETNRRHGVVKGKTAMTSQELRTCFDGPVNAIINNVCKLLTGVGSVCKTVILVGGFAESLYLKNELTTRLTSRKVELFKVDEPTQKAAAEGTAFWYTGKHVVARAARSTFGTDCSTEFDYENIDHLRRANHQYIDPDGRVMISGVFRALIHKSEVVRTDVSHKAPFYINYPTLPTTLGDFEVKIFATDSEQPGTWCLDGDDELMSGFREVCIVKADLSGLLPSLKPISAIRPLANDLMARTFWRINFDVEIFFGQTTLCAGLVWIEDGQVRKSPATLIPSSIA